MKGDSGSGLPDDLLRQVGAARGREREAKRASAREAQRKLRRSNALRAFLQALRASLSRLVVRCAWCERLAVDGEWLPDELRHTDLPEDLSFRTTHGICPACFAEVLARAPRS